MKGLDFATRFVPFYQSYFGLPPDNIRVAEIKANPEQSKHLDTATVSLLGQGGDASHPRKLDLDFCQLRSEEYAEGSRIPTDVVHWLPRVVDGSDSVGSALARPWKTPCAAI
jgi:tRNA nucleotidyltransferase (CCA-adding enzyme)